MATRNQVDGQVIHRTFPLETGVCVPFVITSGFVFKLCYVMYKSVPPQGPSSGRSEHFLSHCVLCCFAQGSYFWWPKNFVLVSNLCTASFKKQKSGCSGCHSHHYEDGSWCLAIFFKTYFTGFSTHLKRGREKSVCRHYYAAAKTQDHIRGKKHIKVVF